MLSDDFYDLTNRVTFECATNGIGLKDKLDALKDEWINEGLLKRCFPPFKVGNGAIVVFSFSDQSIFMVICESLKLINQARKLGAGNDAIVGMVSMLPDKQVTEENIESFIELAIEVDVIKLTLTQIEDRALLFSCRTNPRYAN